MRSQPLHRWDRHTGIDRVQVAPELAQQVGEATVALASRSGGVAVDVLGFPVTSPATCCLRRVDHGGVSRDRLAS